MKARNAAPIRPCTASASARSRARQRPAEHGDQRAEDRQDQHPQQHRAFVIAPDAGESCRSSAAALCEFSATFSTEKSEVRCASASAAKASATSTNWPSAALGPTAISARSPRRAPHERNDRLRQRQRRARGSERNGRLRRSWLGLPLPASGPVSSAPPRPRAACSARRAWRESPRALQPAPQASIPSATTPWPSRKQVRHVGETVPQAIDADALRSVGDSNARLVVRDLTTEPASTSPPILQARSRLDVLGGDLARRKEQRRCCRSSHRAPARPRTPTTASADADQRESAASARQLELSEPEIARQRVETCACLGVAAPAPFAQRRARPWLYRVSCSTE